MLEIWEKQRREDQLGLQKAITLIFLFPQELEQKIKLHLSQLEIKQLELRSAC
jgi:hypothetical protein